MDTVLHSEARDGVAPERRTSASDDLLDELTLWRSQDRAGMFRRWHRGALSLIQLNVVAVLEAEGPLPMSRLAEALDVSVASATGIVDRMESRGLVERRHGTDDRRVVAVYPTERSADIFREFADRRREHVALLLAELTDEEREGFLKGIRAIRAARHRLADAFEQEAAPPGGPGPSAGAAPRTRTPESMDPDR